MALWYSVFVLSELIALDEGVSEEAYLEGEKLERGKREYLGGYVYPVVENVTRDHNRIARSILTRLDSALSEGPCEAFFSDVLVRIKAENDTYYYYPDIVVTCDPEDRNPQYLESPKLIIEVLSPNTYRADTREKWFLYRFSPSVEELVLVEQEKPWVRIARRDGENWSTQDYEGEGTLELKSVGLSLTLDEIYKGIEFD